MPERPLRPGQIAPTSALLPEVAHRSEASWHATLLSVGDAVLVTDAEGRIELMNPVAEALTGWKESEARGWPLEHVLHLKCRTGQQPFEQLLRRVLRDGEVVRLGDGAMLIARDGTKRSVLDSGAPIHDPEGRVTGAVFVFSDQTALRASEENFRRTFDLSPVGIVLIKPSGGFLRCNDAYCAFLGYSEQELLQKTFLDVSHPDDVDIGLAECRAVLLGDLDVARIQKRYLRKSGDVVWGDLTIRMVRSPEGEPLHFITVVQDVTARRLAEEALTVSWERLRAVTEGTSDAVYMKDPSGRYLLFNASASRFVGKRAEEVIGQDDTFVFAAAEAHRTIDHDRAIMAGGRTETFEESVTTADGTLRTFQSTKGPVLDADGRVLGLFGISRDITDHQRADEALRESETRFRLLFRGIADAVLVHGVTRDGLPGQIVAVNDAACERLAYTREELLQLAVRDIQAPESTVDLRAVFDRLSQGEKVLFEETYVASNGQRIPVEVNAQAFEMHGSRVVLSVARDMTERKRVEAERRESDARYRSLFENMLNGFAYCRMLFEGDRPVDFVYLAVNSAFETLTGLRDVVGRKVSAVIPGLRESDPVLLETYGRVARTGVPEKFENYVEPLKMWFAVSVYSPGADHFVAVFDVITERKRAEQTLRESEARFRQFSDAAFEGLMFHDKGVILDANQSFAEMFGFTTAGDLVGQHVLTALPLTPDSKERIRRQLREHLTDAFEVRAERPDGTFRVMETHGEDAIYRGRHVRVVAVRDVTERKHAENALRQAAQQWQTTFDAVGDGVWLLDANQRILRCNKASAALVGRAVGDIEGRPCWEVAHGTAEPIPNCPFTRMRQTLRHEQENLEHDGRTQCDSVDPIVGPNGELQGAVHVLSDTTEHRRLEQQFIHAQKMESIGRLAGGVAHDFNNMLCVILGQAELAMEQVDPSTRLYDDLREIQTAGQRSAALTNQLLAFARRQAAEPRVVDLNACVEVTLKMLRRLIGEQIELAWLPSPGVWSVKLDPGQLDQVLANLAVNARDAIGGPGTITIKTQNVVAGKAEVAAQEDCLPGEYVVMAVSDTGCGMSRDVLDRIFEPFFTTKKQGEGTGLGLATVYGIVKQNGGFIQVSSARGEGTTFKIHLPRQESSPDAMTPGEQAPPRSKGETVLLVEDEAAVLNLSKRMLEDLGYTVYAASTPAEALRIAEARGTAIDLLLTDIVMPEMTGRELAQRLAAQLPGLKQLFVSGYHDLHDGQAGAAGHYAPVLRKPFSSRALASKVREALG